MPVASSRSFSCLSPKINVGIDSAARYRRKSFAERVFLSVPPRRGVCAMPVLSAVSFLPQKRRLCNACPFCLCLSFLPVLSAVQCLSFLPFLPQKRRLCNACPFCRAMPVLSACPFCLSAVQCLSFLPVLSACPFCLLPSFLPVLSAVSFLPSFLPRCDSHGRVDHQLEIWALTETVNECQGLGCDRHRERRLSRGWIAQRC